MRGVPGTYGNGYEGVRRGIAAGVAAALPRMVRDDEDVDSVEAVWVVANGLLKAAVRGETVPRSSLMGEGRRGAWADEFERETAGDSESG